MVEIYDYKRIEKSFTKISIKRTKVYYCDDYSSWQRGSNENANRIIRRFLPKGESLKGIMKNLFNTYNNLLISIPGKCLIS